MGNVEPLGEGEERELWRLLYRHASAGMDQFDLLRFHAPHGPVYVDIRLELPPGVSQEAYRLVDPGLDGGAR